MLHLSFSPRCLSLFLSRCLPLGAPPPLPHSSSVTRVASRLLVLHLSYSCCISLSLLLSLVVSFALPLSLSPLPHSSFVTSVASLSLFISLFLSHRCLSLSSPLCLPHSSLVTLVASLSLVGLVVSLSVPLFPPPSPSLFLSYSCCMSLSRRLSSHSCFSLLCLSLPPPLSLSLP